MTGLDLPIHRIPLPARSHPITPAPALMPQHDPTMSEDTAPYTVTPTAPSPGAAAAADQTAEERRARRRNVASISMPDAILDLARRTNQDPEDLAQRILDQQAAILAARAAEALKAVLP